MSEQSSRFERAIALGAVAGALAIAGVAATGCGSDDNDSSGDINKAIDSIQSQASSVQSQVSTAVTSVQSQIQTETQSNGGSSAGGY